MPKNPTSTVTKSLQCVLNYDTWRGVRRQIVLSDEDGHTIPTMTAKMADLGVKFKEIADELGVDPEQLLNTVRENCK